MDEKELKEKLSQLSPEEIKMIETYVDYLLYKVNKQEKEKDENVNGLKDENADNK